MKRVVLLALVVLVVGALPASAQQPEYADPKYQQCPFPPTAYTDDPVPVDVRSGWEEFDVDGDGFVTKAEMSELRSSLPLGAVPSMWSDWDRNANGVFEVTEFDLNEHVDPETGQLYELDELAAACQDDYLRSWAAAHLEQGVPYFGMGDPPQGVGPRSFVRIPNGGLAGDVAALPGDLADAAEDIASAPSDFITDKVSEGFDKMVEAMANAADSLIIETSTAWLRIDSASATNTDVSNALQQDLRPLTALLAVVGLIVGVGRMLITMRGAELRTQISGVVRLMIISAAGTTIIITLLEAGDVLADTLVSNATDGGLDTGGLAVFSAAMTGGASIGAILLLAILAIITSIIQLGLFVIRSAVIVVLAGFLPVAAAASMVGHNRMLAKASAWLLAFICFKPAAAAIYGGAFRLMGGDSGADIDMLSVIQGLMLLVLAVAALPTAMRLFAPIADMGGPSAAGVMAGGAAVVGGGMMLAGAGGFGGASGAQISGGGSTVGSQINQTENSAGVTQPPGAPPSGSPGGRDGGGGPSGAPGSTGMGTPGPPGTAGTAGTDSATSASEGAGAGERNTPAGSRIAGAGMVSGGLSQAGGGALDGPDEEDVT